MQLVARFQHFNNSRIGTRVGMRRFSRFIENIHKYYKKSKDGRAGRQDGKSYRFFAQLDALFGGQQQTTTQVETDTAAAVAAI